MGNCFQPTVSSTEMRVNYRTDRIRSYMTSSESSSGEEIIGTGQFLSDYVFMSWFKSIVTVYCMPVCLLWSAKLQNRFK